jgi:HipA-like protein
VSELLILIEGALAGNIRADKSDRLSLDYENTWRDSRQGYSLSVSMPLAEITYPQKAVRPYLWNPLPENPNVLQRWGQPSHVSAANPFKLLMYVGADVPGAAQFVPPKLLEEIQSAQRPAIEHRLIQHAKERLASITTPTKGALTRRTRRS